MKKTYCLVSEGFNQILRSLPIYLSPDIWYNIGVLPLTLESNTRPWGMLKKMHVCNVQEFYTYKIIFLR